MQIREGLEQSIGNTPLIKLNKLSEETGCTILGKAEFMNPGGSVKDRPGLFIIKDAEERGALDKGGLIVEGTAGNTGIGLATVANARGYKTLICIPETQSAEKKSALRIAGAELIEVPAVPYANPNQYQHFAERLAEKLAKTEQGGVLYANQWDNLANRRAHLEGTGPEIWEQTEGKVDGFICAIGTGGTLSGVAMALKERNKDVQIGLADPYGAKMYMYFKEGKLEAEGGSIAEGIGQGRITANVDGTPVDHPYRIGDEEALNVLFDVMEHEGLCLGGSSAINLAGAVRLAKELGPGKTIVTVLCDHGTRYQSKLWNPEFLRSKGLPVPAWLEKKPRDVSDNFVAVEG